MFFCAFAALLTLTMLTRHIKLDLIKYFVVFNETRNLRHGQRSHPVENGMQQCRCGNIVPGCQQYCSVLLHLIAG